MVDETLDPKKELNKNKITVNNTRYTIIIINSSEREKEIYIE
jgi:hypothetical protein